MVKDAKMKKFIFIVLSMVLFISAKNEVNAQDLKFGHINSNELMQLMPEFESARNDLEKLRQQLTSYLEEMSADFRNKYNSYLKDNKNLSDIVKLAREQELNDMDSRIQEFQNNAQIQMQEKQNELFNPVYTKLDNAIKTTGRENNFLYIFDTSQGELLYFDKIKSIDITPLVKVKLGLK